MVIVVSATERAARAVDDRALSQEILDAGLAAITA